MKNNEISLEVFEDMAAGWLNTTSPPLALHDQRILCRIVLSLIGDVRELTAALAIATEASLLDAAGEEIALRSRVVSGDEAKGPTG